MKREALDVRSEETEPTRQKEEWWKGGKTAGIVEYWNGGQVTVNRAGRGRKEWKLGWSMLSKILRNNRIIGVACVCTGVGLLLVGLWPLDFFPENAVRWLPDRGGLEFYGDEISTEYCAGGVALTPEPTVLPFGNLSMNCMR